MMGNNEKHVWIVEMLCSGKWHPTVGCSLVREDGRTKLKDWQEHNPDDKFRLKKYIRGAK